MISCWFVPVSLLDQLLLRADSFRVVKSLHLLEQLDFPERRHRHRDHTLFDLGNRRRVRIITKLIVYKEVRTFEVPVFSYQLLDTLLYLT